MPTTIVKCDYCHKQLTSLTEGWSFQGNVYAVDPRNDELIHGVIGNNFPKSEPFARSEVQVNHLCIKCGLINLGLLHLTTIVSDKLLVARYNEDDVSV